MRSGLTADPAHRLIDESTHSPVARAAADAENKIAQDDFAFQRVTHLGMELDCENLATRILHSGDVAR